MGAPSRFPWKAVAIGGAVLGALGIATIATRRQERTGGVGRVALIGDSYAVGLGPELDKLLPDFKYEGHEGSNSSQWAHHAAQCGRCGDWITAYKPKLVLVSLGVNDDATPNAANYQTIVSGLQGVGARVVWVEPPVGVKNVDAVRRVIASLGVQTIPATTASLSADSVHPRSYAPWAQDIVQAIQ